MGYNSLVCICNTGEKKEDKKCQKLCVCVCVCVGQHFLHTSHAIWSHHWAQTVLHAGHEFVNIPHGQSTRMCMQKAQNKEQNMTIYLSKVFTDPQILQRMTCLLVCFHAFTPCQKKRQTNTLILQPKEGMVHECTFLYFIFSISALHCFLHNPFFLSYYPWQSTHGWQANCCDILDNSTEDFTVQ